MVRWTGELAKLSFPAHPHMLRHGCGFKLANDGVDTRALQHYLGHRNIMHTVRYTRAALRPLRWVLEGLTCRGPYTRRALRTPHARYSALPALSTPPSTQASPPGRRHIGLRARHASGLGPGRPIAQQAPPSDDPPGGTFGF